MENNTDTYPAMKIKARYSKIADNGDIFIEYEKGKTKCLDKKALGIDERPELIQKNKDGDIIILRPKVSKTGPPVPLVRWQQLSDGTMVAIEENEVFWTIVECDTFLLLITKVDDINRAILSEILSDDYVNMHYGGFFTGAFVGLAAVDYSGYGSKAEFAFFEYKVK